MRPLEAANCWALSCRSSKYKELSFHVDGPVFEIEIDRILLQHYFFERLETNVLYHNEKMKGESELCPPASDFLFLTKDGRLVFMDVTGGRGEDVLEMEKGLAEWIEEERSAMRRRDGMWSNSLHVGSHSLPHHPPKHLSQSSQKCPSSLSSNHSYLTRTIASLCTVWYSLI